MKKIVFIISSIIIFASINYCKAENYAILISAGIATTDDVFSNSEYWYDLFLAYEDLIINEGYTHENVIVFYGDGNDFENTNYPRYRKALHGWQDPIVDFNNAYNTMNTQFANLGSILTSDDNLLIRWVVGHGDENGWDNYSALIQNRSLWITEQQIYNMMNQISNYLRRKILWMTCRSGCIVHGNESFNNNNTTIISSSNWNQDSYGYWLPGESIHAEFNYVVTSALYGEDPLGTAYDADINNDNELSMQELFVDADNSPVMSSDPQLGDNCPRSARTFIDEILELNGANISNTTDYQSDEINASNYIVSSGGNVTFAANDRIKLQTGFRVYSGSSFHAFRGNIACTGTTKSAKVKSSETKQDEDVQYEIKTINNFDIDKIPFDYQISIYPNPNEGLFNIEISNYKEVQNIKVYNLVGTLIHQINSVTSDIITINLSEYPKGTYIIKTETTDNVYLNKIFIE